MNYWKDSVTHKWNALLEGSTGHPAEGYLTNVHGPSQCEGEFCTIHLQSDHPMRDWPQVFRARMFRVCEHGKHHCDPDDLFISWSGEFVYVCTSTVCDGCCEEVMNGYTYDPATATRREWASPSPQQLAEGGIA